MCNQYMYLLLAPETGAIFNFLKLRFSFHLFLSLDIVAVVPSSILGLGHFEGLLRQTAIAEILQDKSFHPKSRSESKTAQFCSCL